MDGRTKQESISLEELLAEFERLGLNNQDDSFKTTKEWQDEWGLGIHRTRKILKKAQEAGMLEVKRVMRHTIDGYTRTVSAYRIKK